MLSQHGFNLEGDPATEGVTGGVDHKALGGDWSSQSLVSHQHCSPCPTPRVLPHTEKLLRPVDLPDAP